MAVCHLFACPDSPPGSLNFCAEWIPIPIPIPMGYPMGSPMRSPMGYPMGYPMGDPMGYPMGYPMFPPYPSEFERRSDQSLRGISIF